MNKNVIREFAFQPADFNYVRNKLQQLTGITLSDSKDAMVYSRLARRLRSLGLSAFEEYIHLIEVDPAEVEVFINALTTNLTAFFREPHHFDILQRYFIEHPHPLTVWSAACSSGEEAYSIAMTAAEARGTINHNIKVLASDIDSNMLAVAQRGVYPVNALGTLSNERKRAFFMRGIGNQEGWAKVKKGLRRSIKFYHQNLLDHEWQTPSNVDIIVCRNVMIYFEKELQSKLLERFAAMLNPEGLYIAGHSESILHPPQRLRAIGQTVYQVIS